MLAMVVSNTARRLYRYDIDLEELIAMLMKTIKTASSFFLS
jgi:hypothetical protein